MRLKIISTCVLWRWRINLKSLSFTWCTSLGVGCNFHCDCVARNIAHWSVCDHFLSLWVTLVERTRLRDGEYPLVARVLYGPCEKISKILITEADLGEEVTYDVSLGLLPPLSLSLCLFWQLVHKMWPVLFFVWCFCFFVFSLLV